MQSHLLKTYYIVGTVLGDGDSELNSTQSAHSYSNKRQTC